MIKGCIKDFIIANRSIGKRECFMWEDQGLDQYLNWSFAKDYLFIVLNKNGISGVGVAYPLPKECDFTLNTILPSEEVIDDEKSKNLFIADWIAKDKETRRRLVSMFKYRFSNWENQRKFGMHYGKIKELNNNYINKLNNI